MIRLVEQGQPVRAVASTFQVSHQTVYKWIRRYIQLTTNHPARVAERVSTLDLLSGGRVEDWRETSPDQGYRAVRKT